MHFYMKTISKLNTEFHRRWPLFIALAVFWITTAFLLIISLKMNQGHFVYGLDDAYIHMAIAKNFALHGVWGVTQYGFSSSSSSLLWTLLLSFIYVITGVNSFVPFILNIILGTITVLMVYYILRSFKILPIYNLIIMLAVIFFTPIPYLIFIGMEHILQIVLVIAFVYLSVRILTNANSKSLDYYLLLVLAVPLALVRYESLILIFLIAILFMLKKRFTYSFLIIGISIIPIIIYGIISTHNGWYFLPNSLVVKSTLTNSTSTTLNSLPNAIYSNLIPHDLTSRISDLSAIIFAFIALSIATFRYKVSKTIWQVPTLWLTITAVLIFMELIFITNDWIVRYTSYLVVLGLISIILGIYDYIPRKLSFKFNKKSIPKYLGITILIILILSPFAMKTYYLSITPQATNNIYEQQYQMGLFLNDFYQNDSIAVNDIGAVNYLANIHSLDLVGLSSIDAAQEHKDNTFNLSELANKNNVQIAIIYDQWWTGQIPSNWIKVGEWTTPNVVPHNLILGNDTVSFYATSPQYEVELINNLRSFSPQLPKDIKQSGIYTNNLN